jgi:guanylate kinase
MLDPKYNLAYSISMTTRPMREGEVNGKQYFFKTKAGFKKAIKDGELLEYATYCDNYYGTPKHYVEQLRNKGKNVLLEIEVQGAIDVMKFMKKQKDHKLLTIFVLPPSKDELLARLNKRGTESKEIVQQRITTAKFELAQAKYYQHTIVNDDITKAQSQLREIISNAINNNV